jgi:DNA-binding NarL/FixJ family response regulator
MGGLSGLTSDSIVGRDIEAARLRSALDAARAGHPTVALVTGAPGIGKTSLWRALLSPAPGGRPGAASGGLHLLVATGDEAEADLDHGIVSQLLRRAPLDDATRAALDPGPGADPVGVGSVLLALLDRVDHDRPIVVVVDDTQWADEGSLRAITFAARRLREDRVLLCVTCRDDACDRLPAGLVRLAEAAGARVDLGPLDRDAVGELAARAYGQPVPAGVVARLYEHAGGHPLHTRALLDELPLEALTGAGSASLPVPRSYANLVLAQVAGCRDGARSLVAALAVLGVHAPVADVARVAGCADPLPAVDELVARGLVELRPGSTSSGTTLAFPHRLMQAAIVGDLSPSRRVALHAAAVAVTEGDSALSHRLAAAVGPDPGLVAAARARAGAHLASGAVALAARQLLAAAPLAAQPAEREHLVAVAAAQVALSGAPVDGLVAEVRGFPESALRSCVLGRSALTTGDLVAAERWLVDAWDRAGEPGAGEDTRAVAAPVADLLAVLALHRRDGAGVVTWSHRALETGVPSGLSATIGCHGLALEGRFAEAVQEMTTILASDPPPELRRDAQLGRGVVRVWADDLDGAESDLAAVDAESGALRSILARVDVRSFRAEAAYRAGRWPEALDLAESTASIVDDAGDPVAVALPHAVASFVLAGMGRMAEARAHAEAAAANARATGLMPARLWSAHAALRVAAAAGDHAEVGRIGDDLVAEGFDSLPEGIHHWRATYVESLLAVGRLDDAAKVAAQLADHAAPRDDVSVQAEAARAEALVAGARGDRQAAEAAFAAGLALDAPASRPFVRARLELAAGAQLRRAGQRRAAATLLAQAAIRFEALGAAPWAARCAREAQACGLRPRPRTASDDRGRELTAQERLVARLVAGGRTNREVAGELVISTKTVEHHLGRVYTKLGLRSRTELAAHMLGGAEARGDDRDAGTVGGGT